LLSVPAVVIVYRCRIVGVERIGIPRGGSVWQTMSDRWIIKQ